MYREKTYYIEGLVLFAVPGIHWGSSNISPVDRGYYYTTHINRKDTRRDCP